MRKNLLAVPNLIYPQFATHNAHTLAAILSTGGQSPHPGQYEFQCLHGMGEPLYEQVTGKVADGKSTVRVVFMLRSVHMKRCWHIWCAACWKTVVLTPRFVNRIADTSLPLDELVADPVTAVEKLAQQEGQTGLPHPKILPRDLYGHGRDNSAGLDPR